MTTQKRTYSSKIRKDQALDTRMQLIESARNLFYKMGYSGTTIKAIAKEAGVSQETVYAIFHNKQTILVEILNQTLVGDADPTPLLQRPFILKSKEQTDSKKLIKKFAADIYEIMGRMSPVFYLLQTASQNDPTVAELLEKTLQQRVRGMRFFVDQLIRMGALNDNMSPDLAAETVWALSSAEVFDLFTKHRGWTKNQYIEWLSSSLNRLLLNG